MHGKGRPSNELLTLRQEAADLRAALAQAESVIRDERRLVTALHADNDQIKVNTIPANAISSTIPQVTVVGLLMYRRRLAR